jgi:hypothetical protein
MEVFSGVIATPHFAGEAIPLNFRFKIKDQRSKEIAASLPMVAPRNDSLF